MERYIELAQRTSATALDAPTLQDRTERCCNPAKLRALKVLLARIATQCRLLDTIKRDLFYGKDLMSVYSFDRADTKSVEIVKASAPCTVKLMHGVVGKVTEAGEMAEALIAMLEGKQLDLDNVIEEIGDSQWYDAEIAAALGFITFHGIQKRNIAKLQARFPERYTDEKALNRDLAAERKVLEAPEIPIDKQSGSA